MAGQDHGQYRTLLLLSAKAEEVADGLHRFRVELPASATRITAVVGTLFNISALLKNLDAAQDDRRYSPSFYRVRDDVAFLLPSLQHTLDAVVDMFARTAGRPYQMVWDDLNHHMTGEEGCDFLIRHEWYHSFLLAQCDILAGRQPRHLAALRRLLTDLTHRQNGAVRRLRRRSMIDRPALLNMPRPGRAHDRRRQSISYVETPLSPTSMSDYWDYMTPPFAPEPPAMSPSGASVSSPPLDSSQTSYGSDYFRPVSPRPPRAPPVHWAQYVYDGSNPVTLFGPGHQLDDASFCIGTADPNAIRNLTNDRFLLALELPFDSNRLRLCFYWRPRDNRARVLIIQSSATQRPSSGREVLFCQPLNNLKVIRNESCIQLCHMRRDGGFRLWARLNFDIYERMVLFYCTFVAMKRQDSRPVAHTGLLDDFELEAPDPHPGEKEEYGGEVMHGHRHFALRLFRDTTSDVVRLEATALRGPMKDVPLWTLFVTRYATDPDWMQLEQANVVSLISTKPDPYVFVAGYEVPRNENGEVVLTFATSRDARYFVEVWTGLCHSRGGR